MALLKKKKPVLTQNPKDVPGVQGNSFQVTL